MRRCALLAIVAYMVMSITCPQPTEASALDVVDVRITVIDAASNQPVAGAVVHFDLRSQRLLGRTDFDGELKFEGTTVGPRSLEVDADGFETLRETVDISPGSDVNLTLKLTRSNLKEIGRVKAADSSGAVVVSRSSTASSLFPDFSDLLNRLGDASISTGTNGRLGAITFAGKDASLTTLSFDGVDLSDPVARHAIDPDLIQSARSYASTTTIDLFSLATTPWPQYTVDSVIGGYDDFRSKLSFQDTLGRLGIAAQYASNSQHSDLFGAHYLDSSGLNYTHRGAFNSDSIILKANGTIGRNTTAEASALVTRSYSVPSSPYSSGSLPSGNGPGTSEYDSSSIVKIGITATGRHALVTSSLSQVNNSITVNDLSRFSGGSPLPSLGTTLGKQYQFSLSINDFASPREVLNVNANIITNDNFFANFDPLFGLGQFSARDFTSTKKLSIKESISASHTTRLLFGLDASSDNHGNGTALLTGAVDVRRGQDAFRVTASAGRTLAHRSVIEAFGDPQSATYDCASGSIFANGPNQEPTSPEGADLRVGWTRHRLHSEYNLEFAATIYNGISVSGAYVPSNAATIDPAYLAALRQGFSILGGCDQSIFKSLYFTEDVGGASSRYLTGKFAGTTKIGRLTLQTTGNLQSAVLLSSPRALAGAGSPYIVGSQLPNVPLLHGTATLQYPWNDRRSEAIVSIEGVGSNNQRHLPAYLQLTAGIAHAFGPDIDAFIVFANPTRSYTGLLNSPTYSQTLPTIGGGTFSTLAAPLTQPNILLNVRIKVRHGD